MVTINQTSISAKRSGFLSKFIPNPKERKLVISSLLVTIILILVGIFWISQHNQELMSQDFRHYKGTFKQLGSISRIGYFATLSIYPIFLLVKWKRIKNLNLGIVQVKTLLQYLAKIVRKWHVPAALLSTGIVILHGLLAIIRGFKLDFTYLSGISATIVLFFLMVMGLKRFKRTDKKWHFKLAIGFLILFMLHASF